MTTPTTTSRPLSLLSLLLLVCAALPVSAQDETPTAVTDQNRTGELPFSTSIGTDVESVDVSTGSPSVRIPFTSVKGRGMDFSFGLRYEANFWNVATRGTGPTTYQKWNLEKRNWLPDSTGLGWEPNQPRVTHTSYREGCGGANFYIQHSEGYIYHDSDGGKHGLELEWQNGGCQWTIFGSGIEQAGFQSQVLTGPDSSGAGIWATINFLSHAAPSIVLADGTSVGKVGTQTQDVQGPFFYHYQQLYGDFRDPNGNKKSEYAAGLDTLGRAIVTQQNGTNQILYKVYDSNGVQQTYTVNYGTISLSTAFNISGAYGAVQELATTRKVITSIVLPNGRSYAFQYENNSYGGLTRVDLPSGAYVTYTWGTFYPASNSPETRRHVTSRTVHVDGQDHTWTLSRAACTYPCQEAVTVTDPLGNQSTYETQAGNIHLAKLYQGPATGTPSRQYSLDYFDLPSFRGNGGGGLVTSITTALENGLVAKKEFDYETFDYDYETCWGGLDCAMNELYYGDGTEHGTNTTSRGNVKEIREYDWGSGAPGSLLRRTTKQYLHTSNSNYLTRNIVSKIIKEFVFDGSNPTATDCLEALGCKARAEFEYDSTAITATSGAPQHDYTGYPSTFIYRGNATRVKKWRNTDGALLTTSYIYDDLGNIRSITDPGLHTTTWDYNDNWSGSGCLPPANSLAYVKQVTNHLGHRIQLSRFPCTGRVQSRKDENDILAARPGTTFTYDLFGRLLTKLETDGLGQTTNAYNDVPPVSVTSTTKITSTLNLVSTAIQDSLGRVKQTQLTSDPEGAVFTDTTYDALGRTKTVTNPYRTTSDPTYGMTETQYDALSRVTKIIPPDGSPTSNNIVTTYAGTTVTVTDQAGKVRKSESDALGRLIRVWEPNSSGSLVNKTRYFYDTLDNLTCVLQLATDAEPASCAAPSATWRPRTFAYNSLSQLLTAVNPESGAISYTYDSDGNVLTKVAPKPNQTGALTVTTTYTYDVLHRLTQKSYNDGSTALVKYGYDAVALTGCTTAPPTLTITNGKGRRTAMCDASGAATWSYDPEGAPLTEKRTLLGSTAITKNTDYQYNLDGSLKTLIYPSGRVVNYAYSAAARPTSAVDATGTNYVTDVTYKPHGAVYTLVNGKVAGGFAGITTALTYNKRLQPEHILATTGALDLACATATGKFLHFFYAFGLNVNNNGNVQGITNCLSTTRNQTFTYDELNRLATAQTTSSLWGNSYVYDIWGNLTNMNSIPGKTNYQNLQAAPATTKNQLTGYTHDAAGNLTNNGGAAYTYDAENRLKTAGGATYHYDGDGKRLIKEFSASNKTLYWTGTASDAVGESNASGTFLEEYIFFSGKRVAKRTFSSGVVNYYFGDHLGTSRLITSATGGACYDADFYPYGKEQTVYLNTCPQNYKFTGKERDGESGLDYFGARNYGSNMGRFVLPDAPFADQHPLDPSTWNLYTYSKNNPSRFVDLDGRASVEYQRAKAVRLAWEAERQLVATGRGTYKWSAAERAELSKTGRVAGYQGHHINSVKGHPEHVGNPNNVEFVKGAKGNLEKHGGNFRNPTSGPLMNRASTVLTLLQVFTAALAQAQVEQITGISEGVRFRGLTPHWNALTVNDPAKAAMTLDGLAITVFGPNDTTTQYDVHDGNYYPAGSDKHVDPTTLEGAHFEIQPDCRLKENNCA